MLTIASNIHIKDVAHLNVDRAKEALVSLLEFLLIKDLDRQHTLIGDNPRDIK